MNTPMIGVNYRMGSVLHSHVLYYYTTWSKNMLYYSV